jgi:hypothetical protein
MRISKKVKLILLFFSLSLLFLAGWGGNFYYQNHYKIIWEHQEKREEKFSEIEKSFSKNPTVKNAGILMGFYFGQRNYKKALYFGNECIKLGGNVTPIGFSIHYQLALINKEIGDIDLSRKHLKTALRLDKDRRIFKYNWINRDNLTDILSQEELESYING